MKNNFKQLVISLFLLVNIATPVCAGENHPHGITSSGLGTIVTFEGDSYNISGGTQKGSNLFHSFEKFNVHSGENANFNDSGITNTIGRVTGNEYSWINGTIKSGATNLYLLNPKGIMFGPDASLDLSGSFHVSTANYLKLGDTGRFDVSDPGNTILTVAHPSAFGFLDAPADIRFQGSHLNLLPGKYFTVTGGDISMDKARIFAPDGTIGMTSVGYEGQFTQTELDVQLSSSDLSGKISISGIPNGCEFPRCGVLDINGNSDGMIVIRGGDFFMSDAATINANSFESGSGKKVDIEVSGKLKLDAAKIYANNYDFAQGGSISMTAGQIEANATDISASTGGSEKGGSITVDSEKLKLTTGAQIRSSCFGPGQGGNLTVYADEIVFSGISETPQELEGYGSILFNSGLSASSFSPDAGDGGELYVNSGYMLIKDMANISAATVSSGKGGSIKLEIDRLEVTDGGAISSSSMSSGKAGAIDVKADEIILSSVGAILSYGFGSGKAGKIILNTEQLELINGGNISTSTLGFCAPNTIEINVSETLRISGRADESMNYYFEFIDGQVDGALTDLGFEKEDYVGPSGIHAAVVHEDGPMSAGEIIIKAENIEILGGARISSENRGTGDAGYVSVLDSDNIRISDSTITTRSISRGGGDIKINVSDKLYLSDSKIETSVIKGDQKAGNINIRDPKFITMNHSNIVARADEGAGGAIDIAADQFIQSFDSDVNATSNTGIDGVITIESPNTDISTSLTLLPSNFLDITSWLKTPCSERFFDEVSRFRIIGRDAAPTPIDDLWPSPPLLIED